MLRIVGGFKTDFLRVLGRNNWPEKKCGFCRYNSVLKCFISGGSDFPSCVK